MRSPLSLPRLPLGLLAIALLVGALVLTVPAVAFDPALAGAQVTDLDEEVDDTPGLGVITGTPDPGPDPEDAGDRGGFAQLGVAIVLLGGIAFIASRVIKGARLSG